MKCDFRDTVPTKRAWFKCKLSGEPIHFGYIPVWRLPAFVRFCKEHNLITAHPEDRRGIFFTSNHYFLYTITDSVDTSILGTMQIWLADLLGKSFATRKNTINVGGGEIHTKWRYTIRNGRYIV
jgi:hypothetical protein